MQLATRTLAVFAIFTGPIAVSYDVEPAHPVVAMAHCTTGGDTPTATKITMAATPNLSIVPNGSEWLERAYVVELRGVDHDTPTPYWMRTDGVYPCTRMKDAEGAPVDVWRSTARGPCELNVSDGPDGLTVTAWEIASVQSNTAVEIPAPQLRQALLALRGESSSASIPPITLEVPPESARALRGKSVSRLPVTHARQTTGRYRCID